MKAWLFRLPRSVAFWIMLGVVVWAFTFSWGWYQNQQRSSDIEAASHRASVQNCIALNELKRNIFVTLGDFDVPMAQRRKYRPTRNCERLP